MEPLDVIEDSMNISKFDLPNIISNVSPEKNYIEYSEVPQGCMDISGLDLAQITCNISPNLKKLTVPTEITVKKDIEQIEVLQNSTDTSGLDFATNIHNLSSTVVSSLESSSMSVQEISYNIECRSLIKNGNCLSQRQYFIDCSPRSLSFRNTCPFDSIFEIITSMYIENRCFRNDVNK